MQRLALLAFTMFGSLAFAAAPNVQTAAGSSGCCSFLITAVFIYIYRSGGADWVRSIAAAFFPGLFGWFIWRDRSLGNGARWTSLVFASLQVFFFLAGIVLALAAPAVLSSMNPVAAWQPSAIPKDVSHLPEDPTLGLHPVATITSDPAGAKVFVNGVEKGKTPLETPLNAGEGNKVKVELPSFFTAEQTGNPNAREKLLMHFTLKSAAVLSVTSEPPGARVMAARQEVLKGTPGTTPPLEVGDTELLVSLPGHQTARQQQVLTPGDATLHFVLEPGVKIAVTSEPPQADIFLNGQWLGLTPADIYSAPKGKQTLEVKKEGWAIVKKVFASVTKPTVFKVKLVDTERVAAVGAVTRARVRYDKVDAELEKVQARLSKSLNPLPALEQKRLALDREMVKAATALEQAESKLRAVDESRGRPPPPRETEPEPTDD